LGYFKELSEYQNGPKQFNSKGSHKGNKDNKEKKENINGLTATEFTLLQRSTGPINRVSLSWAHSKEWQTKSRTILQDLK